jgi:hypothetical protein
LRFFLVLIGLRRLTFLARCCGGLFATTSTARSKRDQASGINSGVDSLAMAKPSLPTSKEDRAKAYLQVLFEINSRLSLIKLMKSSDWPYGIAREVCHLQLRHICELVAIGCLVVQGDYTSSPELTGEYSPTKVFRSMEKLYEGFFPQAASITTENENVKIDCSAKPSAMTRKEMETLWGKTGNYMHRLKIKNFFKVEEHSNIWPEIDGYVAKFLALLNPHAVPMHTPKVLVVAGLDGDNGQPNLSFLEYQADGGMHVHHFKGEGETPYWRASKSGQ